MEATRAADVLDRAVTVLQMVIAGLLVFLLFLGVVTLGVEVAQSVFAEDRFELANVISLVNSSIDIILYLFIVVELFRTVIAYVGARNVVLAVVHAGLIAVVRQIITFKPGEHAPMESLMLAGVYGILLFALLVGFLVVHRQSDAEDDV